MIIVISEYKYRDVNSQMSEHINDECHIKDMTNVTIDLI